MTMGLRNPEEAGPGALFGLFCVMGHRTGVNQMVLSRSAFGRRGAYVPGVNVDFDLAVQNYFAGQ